MWREYNPSPSGRRVGDCSVRAVAKALDKDWDMAYILLSLEGFSKADMPSSDAVWGSVLKKNGFVREAVPNSCPDCYTAEDFCNDHQEGVYVLGFGGHVATVEDGILYDSWDSSNEVPQFYWRKENAVQ